MKLLSLILSVCVFSAVRPAFADNQEWVTEEVLRQLYELKSEIRDLKDQIQLLREDVQNKGKPTGKKRIVPSLGLGRNPGMGSDGAVVAVVEFSDYECPFCRRHAAQTLPKLRSNYVDKGKIKYFFRDYPLGFHPNAKLASVAASCAGEQGNYWGMHTALFADDRRLDKDYYLQTATLLGLEVPAFERCIDDPGQMEAVSQDMEAAAEVKVKGTPAFFIGRLDGDRIVDAVALTGAQSYAVFAREIERMLK